jgi:hypothetical protein
MDLKVDLREIVRGELELAVLKLQVQHPYRYSVWIITDYLERQ